MTTSNWTRRMNYFLRPSCIIVTFGGLSTWATISYIMNKRKKETFTQHSKLFTADKESLAYVQTLSRISLPKSHKRAILFITGFARYPNDFDPLLKLLPPDAIYLVPRLVGWGKLSFDSLDSICWKDWALQVEEAFSILSALADEVVVVAHSMGCNLASILAARHKISYLYMLAPNMVPSKKHRIIKRIFSSHAGILLKYIFPLVPFTSSELLANSRYTGYVNYVIPTSALREMWKLQDACSLKWKDVGEVYLVMDPRDKMVAGPAQQKAVLESLAGHSVIEKLAPHAGHNLVVVGVANRWLAEQLSCLQTIDEIVV